jgi:hypothetical protein
VECLAAIAGKGTAGWAVAEEGGQMWQVGSGGRIVVFGHAATEELESEMMNTAGSPEGRRPGASGWASEAAAADFHGSWAYRLAYQQDGWHKANTAGRDVPQGSEMDAVGTGTGRAQHVKASATAWLPYYGNLLSQTASVVPVEAHTAA